MALFPNFPTNRHGNNNYYGQRVVQKIVILDNRQDDLLPESYAKMQVLCTCQEQHVLPVRMVFIGWSKSDKGQPMAIYACPFHGCGARQGWVRDHRTGRPYRLFTKVNG